MNAGIQMMVIIMDGLLHLALIFIKISK